MKNVIEYLIKNNCPGEINPSWAIEKHEIQCVLLSDHHQCAQCWANVEKKLMLDNEIQKRKIPATPEQLLCNDEHMPHTTTNEKFVDKKRIRREMVIK